MPSVVNVMHPNPIAASSVISETSREISASEVRFHTEADDEHIAASTIPAPVAAPSRFAVPASRTSSTLPSASSASATPSSTAVPIETSYSAEFASLLATGNAELNLAHLREWSDDKLDEFLAYLTPDHLPSLMTRLMGVSFDNTFVFRNMSYSIPAGTEDSDTKSDGRRVDILKDINGYLRSGELFAVLGASDAGLTSLFRLLSGRILLPSEYDIKTILKHVSSLDASEASGEVFYNNTQRQSSFMNEVGYLVREDPNLALLTVEETLLFSAALRHPNSGSTVADVSRFKRFLVSFVMKLLNLSHVRDSIVGNGVLRGVSGGEMRRISYGCEIIAGHHMLLAEMPLVGLDSTSARSLFQAVKSANRAGRAMMCSLAQPSKELFDMCDRIMLLSKGRVIFQGKPAEAESYFQSIGFTRPEHKSVPAFLEEISATPEKFYNKNLEVHRQQMERHISQTVETAEAARLDAWQHLVSSYEKSVFANQVMTTIEEALRLKSTELESTPTPTTSSPVVCENVETVNASANEGLTSSRHLESDVRFPHSTSKYRRSYSTQLSLCLKRQLLLFFRNRGLWAGVWAQTIIISLVVGSLFYQLDTEQKSVRVRYGLFWFMVMSQSFGAAQMIPVLMEQRTVYYHQRGNNYYHPVVYYFSLLLPQFAIGIIQAWLLVSIIYPMSGLIHGIGSDQYWYVCIMLLFINWCARSFVMFVCAISPKEVVAQMLVPIFTLLFAAMCGFMSPKDSIPIGWRWFYYLSYFTYTLRGLSLNEIKFLDWSCPPNVACMYSTGDKVLDLYSMNDDYDQRWINLRNVAFFIIAFNFAACTLSWLIDWSESAPAEIPNFRIFQEELLEQDTNPLPPTEVTPQELPKDITVKKNVTSQEQLQNESELSNQQTAIELVKLTRSAPVEPALAFGMDAPTSSLPKHHLAAHRTTSHTSAQALNIRTATLEWKDLSYSVLVPIKKGIIAPAGSSDAPRGYLNKLLLNKTYGCSKPGSMIAMLGVSGAGKSTLLDVLALKKTGGTMTGEILLNGRQIDANHAENRELLHRTIGYCEQFDSHNSGSTIRECIEFSARLRLPTSVPEQEIQHKIIHVMNVLNLTHMQHQIIGEPESGGVSPAVRKKVTIAVELVMDASILFLDEPTTGLDSAGAISVMSAVRDLSRRMSVICTIHQPSEEIVDMFDALYLLKEGGEVAYFGDKDNVIPYFSSQKFGPSSQQMNQGRANQNSQATSSSSPAPSSRNSRSVNLADYALSAIKNAQSLRDEHGAKLPVAAMFKSSMHFAWVEAFLAQTREMIEATSASSSNLNAGVDATGEQLEYAGLWFQFRLLFSRFFKNQYRDHINLFSRIFIPCFFSFIIATLFADLGQTQLSASNRVAMIFMCVSFSCLTSVLKLPQLIGQRAMYFRERGSKFYSTLPFACARWIAEFPYVILEIFALTIIVYFSVGLTLHDQGRHFAIFLGSLFTVRIMAFSYVEFMSAIIASPADATALTTLPLILTILFSGFLIPKTSIPIGWLFMYYLSMLRYPLELLVVNEVREYPSFECTSTQMIHLPDTAISQYRTCPMDAGFSSTGLKCPIQCGQELLDQFGMNNTDGNMILNYFVIVIFIIGFRLLGYLALRFINHIKR